MIKVKSIKSICNNLLKKDIDEENASILQIKDAESSLFDRTNEVEKDDDDNNEVLLIITFAKLMIKLQTMS